MLTRAEHLIIRESYDHVGKLFKVFCSKTKTKASKADFVYAINTEMAWLKRQYPQVKNRHLANKAFYNLLEAYQRSPEYGVRLQWRSLAAFVLNRRPSVLWAVIQARSDNPDIVPVEKKLSKIDEMYIQHDWCPNCKALVKVVRNTYHCCGRKRRKKAS